MKLNDEKVFESLSLHLKTASFYETNVFQDSILQEYNLALEILSRDYSTYKNYIPRMLGMLEQSKITSLSYSLSVFFELFKTTVGYEPTELFDNSLSNFPITDQAADNLIHLFEKTAKSNQNKNVRISEVDFNINSLDKDEAKEIASLIIETIQVNSETIVWSNDLAETVFFQLAILRNICIEFGHLNLFYITVGLFFDRLNTSELYQNARDTAEEIVYTGFLDGYPEFGFFNSFRCYSNQRSSQAALLYANLSMTSFLKKNIPILDKYKKEVIWQSIKFFRDANLNKWAIDVYNGIPNEITFSEYEKRSIDFSYFTSRLAILDEKLPSDLLHYLHKERENILDGDAAECLPWLIFLYNIKRLYPNSDFSDTGLGYYRTTFESLIPSEDYIRHKNIIFGNSETLKKELKISLKKLLKTRSVSDFYYDNNTAITISSRMIQDSFSKQDIESILLSMMVKSDYSLLFAEKDGLEFSSFKVDYDDVKFIDSIYSDETKVAQNLSPKNVDISWFAVSEKDVYQLILNENNFTFHSIDKWDWERFKKLERNSYFSKLQFDDTIKDHNGVRQISNEEYREASLNILEKIQFSDINTTTSSENLFVIKDMELASFPHNMLLNNNEFIHLKKGIANILSTEWYSSVKEQTYLNQDFSKSIWIPTKQGDFTLNHLFGSLEEQLFKQSFTIYQDSELKKPIDSDLNIICSHGSSEIATKQVFYSSSQSHHEPGKIIGEGEILIFFVCHSGSYSKENLRNNINSIVKSAISEGYKAVIAPFWSLHVNIPKIWLSSFMESMNQGNQIVKSVFEANSAVAQKYPTPSAWAAMHLYGNPHLKIQA